MVRIALDVDETLALALTDERRQEAVGRLIKRLVCPGGHDLLVALLEMTAAEANMHALTQADIDAGLAAQKGKRGI